jgi:topoisomerase-4 subunit B
MTDKKKYSNEDIQELKWNEHIRLRPGMYIGRVNLKGFVDLLKGIFSISLSQLKANTISFDFRDSNSGKITIDNIQNPVIDNWSKWNSNPQNPFVLEFQTLNALSSFFTIQLSDLNGIKLRQEYKEGVLSNGELTEKPTKCNKLEIDFTLDDKIWKNEFDWLESFINHEIREFAYLHKKVKFKVSYKIADEQCNIVYFFENGLKDRIEVEKLKGLGGSYFNTYFVKKIKDFNIEVAFAFRDYTVDEPFLKSFVVDYYTHENGSHIDGLLKGLTYGVMKYFQKYDLTEKYKISEKGIKENLIGIINIRMDAPVFSGCVKNKLANPEIIEPIANYVSELLFEKIEADKESTEKLIRKFEI